MKEVKRGRPSLHPTLKGVQRVYRAKVKESLTPAQQRSLNKYNTAESFEKVIKDIGELLFAINCYITDEDKNFKKFFKDTNQYNQYKYILHDLEETIKDVQKVYVYTIELLTSSAWVKSEEDLNLLGGIERIASPIREVKDVLSKRQSTLYYSKETSLCKIMWLMCDSIKERDLMRPLIDRMLNLIDWIYTDFKRRNNK